MNYEKIYNNLIEKAKVSIYEGYTERHHVLPKCLGGSNSEANLIKVSSREHYMLHALLCKIYPSNYKIYYAFMCMCNWSTTKQKRDHKFNSRLYELFRNKGMLLASENRKGKGGLSGEKNPRYGKLGVGSIKIISFPDKISFENAREASEYYGISSRSISRCANQKQRTLNKMAFLRLSEYEQEEYEEYKGVPIIFLTKWVVNLEDNKEYEDAAEAGKELGKDQSAIIHICKERKGTCGGKHFFYLIDYVKLLKKFGSHEGVLCEQQRKNEQLKKVYCVELKKFYNSLVDASTELRVNVSTLCACVSSNLKSSWHKLHFISTSFYEEHSEDEIQRLILLQGDGRQSVIQRDSDGYVFWGIHTLHKMYPALSLKETRKRLYDRTTFPDGLTYSILKSFK